MCNRLTYYLSILILKLTAIINLYRLTNVTLNIKLDNLLTLLLGINTIIIRAV